MHILKSRQGVVFFSKLLLKVLEMVHLHSWRKPDSEMPVHGRCATAPGRVALA
jgi:hypothetical protein